MYVKIDLWSTQSGVSPWVLAVDNKLIIRGCDYKI